MSQGDPDSHPGSVYIRPKSMTTSRSKTKKIRECSSMFAQLFLSCLGFNEEITYLNKQQDMIKVGSTWVSSLLDFH